MEFSYLNLFIRSNFDLYYIIKLILQMQLEAKVICPSHDVTKYQAKELVLQLTDDITLRALYQYLVELKITNKSIRAFFKLEQDSSQDLLPTTTLKQIPNRPLILYLITDQRGKIDFSDAENKKPEPPKQSAKQSSKQLPGPGVPNQQPQQPNNLIKPVKSPRVQGQEEQGKCCCRIF